MSWLGFWNGLRSRDVREVDIGASGETQMAEGPASELTALSRDESTGREPEVGDRVSGGTLP